MTQKIKNADIPAKMLAWPLFGVGMEKFGRDDKPCIMPVPQIGEDEILVRIDAVGLCFSDVKLIKAGEKHPRVLSKDLGKNPVVPGHEAVMTVIKSGTKYEDRFKPGQRFIIQADIYYKGLGVAYGYAIDGGFAQYSVIDKRIIEGDECCYLLPLADSIPSAIAAMIEPWTCVIASYMLDKRKTPLKGGKMLVVGSPSEEKVYIPGELLAKFAPSELSFYGISEKSLAELKKVLKNSAFKKLDTLSLAEEISYDDIFICDIADRKKAEKIAALGLKNAVISFVGDYPDESWGFDVGAIHYKGWFYQGTETSNLSDAYGRNSRSSLLRNGTCWLVGGAGAMGQMHTQLAVESENGPRRILVTDMDDTRIENIRKQLSKTIARKGIEFVTLNPTHFPNVAAFLGEVAKFAESSGGFDDVIMLVPSVPVLNSSAPFLKKDGLMNIFAGIPAGTEGLLNVGRIRGEGIRFIGASGSMTSHLRHTLKLVEENKINPATSLAAIGGMMELKKGLNAVETAKFPGKTVIFPNIEEMQLTPIRELGDILPELKGSLSPDGLYTMETERLILEKMK